MSTTTIIELGPNLSGTIQLVVGMVVLGLTAYCFLKSN